MAEEKQKQQELIRIALCVPMASYISAIFVKTLLAFINVMINSYGNKYKLFVIPNMSSPVDKSRNEMIRKALSLDVHLILFLDADNLCIPEFLDKMLKTMIDYKADLVSALYFKKSKPYTPIVRKYKYGGYWEVNDLELNKVIEVDGVGLGCCLIKTEVFKQLKYPWFKFSYENWGTREVMISEDLYLTRNMMRKGMKMVCNTGIVSSHIGSIADAEEFMSYEPLRKQLHKDETECVNNLSEFTKQSKEATVGKILIGQQLMKDEWNAKNPKKYSEIKEFYKETENQMYDLTHWHFSSRRVHDLDIVNQMKVTKPKNILDFGAGSGSPAIMLAREGFDVTIADLKSKTLDFAEYRFKTNKVPYKVWHTDLEDMPPDEKYDVILCFDVLEHLPKHIMKEYVNKLVKLKHKNTKIIANVTFGKTDSHPMHFNVDGETNDILKKLMDEFDEKKED